MPIKATRESWSPAIEMRDTSATATATAAAAAAAAATAIFVFDCRNTPLIIYSSRHAAIQARESSGRTRALRGTY